VYGSALRVLGDNSAAQDVVQDVFVELWRHPGRYDPAAGTLRTYLSVLARHRAVDLVRSELRRVARQERSYRLTVDRTLDLVRPADARSRVAVHGLRLPVTALLVVRAFELWTHENDIRQAVGWAPSVPDPSTLRLMTDLAARLLPHAAALPEPVEVRLVLTGPGGGTWDVTMGSAPAAATVAIVADAVGFCRLAANRLTPDDLAVNVTGDPARAAAVLAAATTLALD